jgi:alginate O-acetyltransferase complex protein AlgI
MAIGLAHGLGFKLPRNFNLPYLAVNVAEFWHRWHISLSRWLRDYLFIPLGGSRGGRLATCRNLMLTMLLGGFWHGANWNFAVWGLYHGVLLVVHRAIPFPLSGAVGRGVARAMTFLAVLVGWVLFRARSFADIQCLLTRLFWPTEGLSLSLFPTLLAGTCIAAVALGHAMGEWIPWRRIERRLPAPVLGGALAMLLLVVQGLMPATSKLFIYFRF